VVAEIEIQRLHVKSDASVMDIAASCGRTKRLRIRVA
jgi:hypothetical protein